jgi:hypothetical protein
MERISKVDLCGHPGIGYILTIADDAPCITTRGRATFPLNPSKPQLHARMHITIIMFCLGPRTGHSPQEQSRFTNNFVCARSSLSPSLVFVIVLLTHCTNSNWFGPDVRVYDTRLC